jgi:EAL domain-containing protein (putative c-di-GMP-specific phosphodiesterase class I)
MQDNSRMCLTIRGMVDLARHLGLNLIAEGVETQAQFDLLRAAGCEKFQGYLFSRPVGTPQIRELLVANRLLVPQVAPAVGY